jgi:hypothetical protein
MTAYYARYDQIPVGARWVDAFGDTFIKFRDGTSGHCGNFPAAAAASADCYYPIQALHS